MLLLVVAIVGVVAALYFTHHKSVHPVVEAHPSVVVVPKVSEVPSTLTASSMYVGEVFWGRGIEYFAKKSPLKFQFPFSGLSTAVHDKYQNWIGDMECPITSTDIPYQTQVDKLQFNCRPEYLTEAAKWFNTFTLANNHECDNRGETGHKETQANLEAVKIQYFGDCYPKNTDDICEVIAYNAELNDGTGKSKVKIPVAMCGYMYVVDTAPTDAELAVMAKYAAVMPVIAMAHMGVEYRGTAEEAKVSAYHRMIDAGADSVLATHPHVIQNSENYKGKLIQYSPGNFMFDQQSIGRDNTLSLGIGITMKIADKNAIAAYTSIGPDCTVYKDNCLAQLQAKITKRPVIRVSYAPDCFTEPKYYPVPADTTTCSDILKEATWESATTALNPTW